MFRIFCPKEIVSYKDQKDHVESSVATAYPSAVVRLQERLSSKKWYDFALPEKSNLESIAVVSTTDSLAARGRAKAGHVLGRSDWLDRNMNGLNAIFSVNYDCENLSRFGLRTIVCLGYVVGFLLTMIPSLEVFFPLFQEVISYLEREHLSRIWGGSSP